MGAGNVLYEHTLKRPHYPLHLVYPQEYLSGRYPRAQGLTIDLCKVQGVKQRDCRRKSKRGEREGA